MNIKKHWLKSLGVAAVVAMGSANASAHVVAAVTANGNFTWSGYSELPIPGMQTPSFSHPGGRLVATYSAECAVDNLDGVDADSVKRLEVEIVVRTMAGKTVARLSPSSDASPGTFCSSKNAPGFHNVGSFATTRVGNIPAGTYYVDVRGRLNTRKANALMGSRSLVLFR